MVARHAVELNDRMKKNVLIAILLLAGVLRLWKLGEFPVGFTADEASFGYDAYSLLHTGKDQWGADWPSAFRSFGDWKLPVYGYLAMLPIWLGGLSREMVRLPGAMLGIAAVWATYMFVQELFRGKEKGLEGTLAGVPLMAAMLMAISPWHIQLSRGAFEANLTSFFLPLVGWMFWRGIRDAREGKRVSIGWWMCASLILGINLYTYHAARWVSGLIAILWAIYALKIENLKWKQIFSLGWPAMLCLLAVGLPIVMAMLAGEGGRAWDVAIFNPTDKWEAVSASQYESVQHGVHPVAARLLDNKVTYVLNLGFKNWLSYISPRFLFIEGPGETSYGMVSGWSVIHWFELPLLVAGIFYAIAFKDVRVGLMILTIMFAAVPAALSKGHGLAANRAATMLPFMHILSAVGAMYVMSVSGTWKKFVGNLGLLIIAGSTIFWLHRYTVHGPARLSAGMLYGWDQAIDVIRPIADQYDHILLSRRFTEPHIFVMFYMPLDPAFVQQESPVWKEYERQQLSFVDQLPEYALGKYSVESIDHSDLSKPKTLLVMTEEDRRGFPEDMPTLAVIRRPAYPELVPALYIVESFPEVATIDAPGDDEINK